MSRVPLKYAERMHTEITMGGQSYAKGGCSVEIEAFYLRTEKAWMYVVTHYGTEICKILPSQKSAEIMGGWSATDQSIINSFLFLFGIPMKCKRHDDVLTMIRF